MHPRARPEAKVAPRPVRATDSVPGSFKVSPASPGNSQASLDKCRP